MRLPANHREPLRTGIVYGLGHGQRDAAGAETEFLDDLHRQAVLFDLVEADDAERRGAAGDDPGDVVIAHIKEFQGEIGGLGKEFPARIVDVDPDLAQQGGTVFVQPALGLDG